MTDADSQCPKVEHDNSAAQLFQYLRQRPEDIIDARYLMHRFHVSAEDFTHVLVQIEQADPLDN